MEPVFACTLRNGRIEVRDRVRLRQYCQRFRDGQDLELVIRSRTRRRTNEQNRYYWGVVVRELSLATGQPAQAYREDGLWIAGVHDVIKAKFLTVRDPVLGVDVVRSTASLSTREFNHLIEQVREWAASGRDFEPVYIPAPNEVILPDVTPWQVVAGVA